MPRPLPLSVAPRRPSGADEKIGPSPSHFTATLHTLRAFGPAAAGARVVPISAVILTKNSARHLPEVLTALEWCEEVLVFDTGSTDETMAIARRWPNVQLYGLEGGFPGFGRARRQAVALARHDWILSIDSDEVVSAELAAEIAALPLDARIVYAMPFHNYYNGRLITSCGWHPDRHERLFNRRATNFCESELHERVQCADFFVRQLRHPIRHYSYGSVDDFLHKTRIYSRLFAEQHAGRRRAGPVRALARAGWAFFKSYVLQRGCLQGAEGFVISAFQGQLVFWKYLRLAEANRRPPA
ncbi:MAG TPA: glycosyltransferase family 2 protein [Opitutaceae bacterium]|nr:glycosyltransferase family 2 protein [Opitutaceae bacterium]